jgi:hypothetical protein
MIARDEADDCELVVQGVLGTEARGWLYDDGIDAFRADRAADAPLSESALRGQAAVAGQARTYTCVPPGSGVRVGLDRDEDGFRDRDELDAGSDPADAGSVPGGGGTVLIFASSLSLRDDSTPPANLAARRVKFRSAKHKDTPSGVVPAAWGAPGDPTLAGSAGGALLTVYNASGSGEKVTLALPAGNWQRLGSVTKPLGYRYRDGQQAAGPITSITVSASGVLKVAGSGPTWGYTLNEPSQGAVAVRLRLGQGDTWCTSFAAKPSASGANDRVDKFVGAPKSGVPASCPAVP